jgi:hypothetical protein
MHERRAALLDVLPRRREGVLEVHACHDGLGAVVAASFDLRHRCVLRHVDARVHAGLARRPPDRLPVVAGACGDDTGGTLGIRQRRKLVNGTADLERSGALKVLGLEPDLASAAS